MHKKLLREKRKWKKPEISFWVLIGILVFSFFLNFWNIGQNGTGNSYYAACVKSMTQSWHNFFFVSFDPAGMVSVDKPPLGLWMQALSCKIFGYSGWAMLLPQAVSGTLSCLMIYLFVSKYFQKSTGLIAAFLFACTPSVVLVSRNNTMDMQLIFWLLLSIWFLMKSIDTGKWRWLFLCGVLVGVGFNVKMLQAYLIVPAVIVTYLIFTKGKVGKRFLAGAIAAVLMLGVSFAWVAAVDLTPASERPYVDSTSSNSVLELVFGHNGIERLVGEGRMNRGQSNFGKASGEKPSNGEMPAAGQGQQNGLAGGQNTNQTFSSTTSSASSAKSAATTDSRTFHASRMRNSKGMMQNGGGGNSIGTASPLRLWSNALYGQGSWLLLFAITSFVCCFSWKKLKRKDPLQRSLVFWGMWLLTTGVFFSFAGFFHPYYLCMIAPPVAALSGIGLTQLFRFFRNRWKKAKEEGHDFSARLPETAENTSETAQSVQKPKHLTLKFQKAQPWILLAALLADIVISFLYVLHYESVPGWLAPLILVSGVAGTAVLALYLKNVRRGFFRMAVALLAVSMLAGSTYWAWTPVQTAPNATIPAAGPTSSALGGGMGGSRMPWDGQEGSPNRQDALSGSSTDKAIHRLPENGKSQFRESGMSSGLETYLKKNYKQGSFLLTACRSSSIAQMILDTGLPCYAYGGFLGSDNSLTVSKLKELVAQGKITYFLVSEQGGMGNTNGTLLSYVEKNATPIDSSAYSSSSDRSEGTLYLFTK